MQWHSCTHVVKCRKGLNVNEYLHNTSDTSDRFQKHIFVRNTNTSDKDKLEAGQIHLSYCEDSHSH